MVNCNVRAIGRQQQPRKDEESHKMCARESDYSMGNSVAQCRCEGFRGSSDMDTDRFEASGQARRPGNSEISSSNSSVETEQFE